ncbi:hypothetical protein PFDG_03535 [Plasmodium falciparum Dd2]|nr:hypothetical protein PFDG_03535 [Plasmodium falciparum Dd2]
MNSQKNKDFDNFLKNSQLPTKKFRKFKKIVNNNAKDIHERLINKDTLN